MRCSRASRTWTRTAGLTLVELLASLALLAVLAATVAGAHGRLSRQWHSAEQQLAASAAADRLLNRWWSGEEEMPFAGRGQIEQADGKLLHWRTRIVEQQVLNQPLATLRLELTEAGGSWHPPLVAVELLVSERTRTGREAGP